MDPLSITYVCPEPLKTDMSEFTPNKWVEITQEPKIYSILQAIVVYEAYISQNKDNYDAAMDTTDPIKLRKLYIRDTTYGDPWRIDMIAEFTKSKFNQYPSLLVATDKPIDQTELNHYIPTVNPNTYGNILIKLHRQSIIASQDIDTIVFNVMNSLRECIIDAYGFSDIFITGSYPLHKIMNGETTFNDIDIFIPHNISMNFMSHIHATVFTDFNIIASHNRCFTYKIPGHTKSIQIVRMQSDTFNYTSMYGVADISISQCFIVHNLSQAHIRGEVFADWVLICSNQEYDDIKNKTQRFYRKPEEPYYEYGLKRVEKYKERGFTNVIFEPKELNDILPMYDPIQGQYPREN
jgi:hypothetical protein